MDIDAALDGLSDAILERESARAARSGRAIANSPAWSFGPPAAGVLGAEEAAAGEDEDGDDDYKEEY
ncbi:MAG: hypothetical protein BWX69_03274 [Planctomycetes bacterium ADurb.Bin069]|nr:MAG: hypothetical protein BWX69_03274 [Planctomycetes bacterium ADurb.Bin069]